MKNFKMEISEMLYILILSLVNAIVIITAYNIFKLLYNNTDTNALLLSLVMTTLFVISAIFIINVFIYMYDFIRIKIKEKIDNDKTVKLIESCFFKDNFLFFYPSMRKRIFNSMCFTDRVKVNKKLFNDKISNLGENREKLEYIRIEKANIEYKLEGDNLGNVSLLFTILGICISYFSSNFEKLKLYFKSIETTSDKSVMIFFLELSASALIIIFVITRAFNNKRDGKILLTALNEVEIDLKNGNNQPSKDENENENSQSDKDESKQSPEKKKTKKKKKKKNKRS